MPAYVKLTSEEHKTLKKTVLEALTSGVKAKHTAFHLSRLKRSKKPAMTGVATALKESKKELVNIKQILPESKLSVKKAKAKGKTKYEQELEAIKERISKLH